MFPWGSEGEEVGCGTIIAVKRIWKCDRDVVESMS
jgi:hypothetical protein